MIDEIFNVMQRFPGSYVNAYGEVILSERGSVYFIARYLEKKVDVVCKLLEWCSRPVAKLEPYSKKSRNEEWRKMLLDGFNKYLGTNFSRTDMYLIYEKLGNEANHELTLKFIYSGYDMSLLRPKEERHENRTSERYVP